MSGIKNLIKDKYPGHLLGSLEYMANIKQRKMFPHGTIFVVVTAKIKDVNNLLA